MSDLNCDGCDIKWEHIVASCDMDKQMSIRMAPNLLTRTLMLLHSIP